MQYLGGKSRLAKEIVGAMIEYIPFGGTYVEPFCGACSVALKMREYRPDVRIICNDAQPHLIALLKGVSDGSFVPPSTLSKSEWEYCRAHKDENSALTAFAGFAVSYMANFFHGYSPSRILANSRSLLRDKPAMQTFEFQNVDYTDLAIPAGAVIYCDPPYRSGEAYHGVKKFDHDRFMQWAQEKSKEHVVFMSEYENNVADKEKIVWRKTYLINGRNPAQKTRQARTDVLIKI